MKRILYQELARHIEAYHRCAKDSMGANAQALHKERITRLVYDYMPSGSGFDDGTRIDLDQSTGNKLVFHTDFPHIDKYGYYDGWIEHTATIKPSLALDFIIKVSEPNRTDIEDYIHESFDMALRTEWEE